MTKDEAVEKLVKDINAAVNFCKTIIEKTDSAYLLNRAYFSLALSLLSSRSNENILLTEITPHRRLVYIQCLIASITPHSKQNAEITDEDWDELCGKIDTIFLNVNLYLMQEYDNEFHYKACSSWLNVSGKIYMNHQEDYLNDLFLPHDAIFRKLFNISAREFNASLLQMSHSLSHGVFEKIDENKTVTEIFGKEENDFKNETEDDPGFMKKIESILSIIFGMDTFDLQKQTNIPALLLDALSFKQGEDTNFMEGKFAGWPVQELPTKKRPFISIHNHYYCFDQHSLFDNIYRIMYKIIRNRDSTYKNNWNVIQAAASQKIAQKYLSKLLPGVKWIENAYYKGKGKDGKKAHPDVDLLAIYDEWLFIIECKGGRFITESPFNKFEGQHSSLEELLEKTYDQGIQFLNYLENQEISPLYSDKKLRNKTHDLKRLDFKEIIPCAINIDPFEVYSAHPQDLDIIGIDIENPLLAISVNELRVYADIFDNPLVFLDFIRARLVNARRHSIFTPDETEFIGRYLLSANKQVLEYTENISNRVATNIGPIIDMYFYDKLLTPDIPPLWRNYSEPRIQQILDKISLSSLSGKIEASEVILALAKDKQKELAKFIEAELLSQIQIGRPKHISFDGPGEMEHLSIYCWTSHIQKDTSIAINTARAILLLLKQDKRLLLHLTYSDDNELIQCEWQWIVKTAIPAHDYPSLYNYAEKLRTERLEAAKKLNHKIGRNDPCPCGSLLKYKKCCLDI